MDKLTAPVFTANGMGNARQEWQLLLAGKFTGPLLESNPMPTKILFYADGVKLACTGSPVLENLQKMDARRVELILCSTCLDYFGLTDQVGAGIVGGMPDIIEVLRKAEKVIRL